MENQCHTEHVRGRPRSILKTTGEKRHTAAFRIEQHSAPRKRVKMRHLESLGIFGGNHAYHPKSLKNREGSSGHQFDHEEVSQVTEVPVTVDLDTSNAEQTGKNTFWMVAKPTTSRHRDLNTEMCIAKDKTFNNDALESSQNTDKLIISRGIDLDLNAASDSRPMNQDQFSTFKNPNHLKTRELSECCSSTGPLEENNSLEVWKERKQNGSLSSSHGGIPIPIPKQRGRKSKNDVLEKKMEIAKKEQVDRFTKIAAPSRLLNELNPGIINHVRNRKQVHSIIEALVRSERHENNHFGNKKTTNLESETTKPDHLKKQENINVSGMQGLCCSSLEDWPSNAFPGFNLTTQGFPISISEPSMVPEQRNQSTVERFCVTSDASNSTLIRKADTLALKLSSSFKTSENQSPLYNKDPSLYLSVKAATVASQWLKLLQQDAKGRISALRRSKKRVQAVISTELPFLIAKEFSVDKENNQHCVMNSYEDMHRSRWNSIFDQMNKALCEEEKHLQSWSNQVKEMQLHCEKGLQLFQWSTAGIEQMGAFVADSRLSTEDEAKKELELRAAAASIYSTFNFLSTENLSRC